MNTGLPAAASSPRHFAYIDAVRGLAFLAVLSVHTASSVGAFPLKGLFYRGGYGVQLFFLASAVTLCYSISGRSAKEQTPILNFFIRRFFRIAPLFYLAVVFYSVFPNSIPRFWTAQWAPTGVHPSFYPITALFLHGWYPSTFNSIVPGGWSIGVEMAFYLLFPLTFRLLNSFGRAAPAAAIGWAMVWLLFHFGPESFQHVVYPGTPTLLWKFFVSYWFPTQFPVFLTGIAVYWLLKRDDVKQFFRNARNAWLSLAASVAVLLLLLHSGENSPGRVCGIILSIAGIFLSLSGGNLKLLVNRAICYIGTISFSCYITHFAVLGLLFHLMGAHLDINHIWVETGHRWSNTLLFLGLFLSGLAGTVAISTLTFRAIESPGGAAGRWLIGYLARRNEAPRSEIRQPLPYRRGTQEGAAQAALPEDGIILAEGD
jgi:peptidoglycan/LPS O-acetylase OafA/YrhL